MILVGRVLGDWGFSALYVLGWIDRIEAGAALFTHVR